MEVMSDDDDQIQQNPQFQRLMELKNLYNQTKKSLGGEKAKPEKQQKEIKPPPVGTNGSASAAEHHPNRKQKENSTNPDSASLQRAIRTVVVKHGGSCHIDTVVEYIRAQWPQLRRRDGAPSTTLDTKKTIQANIRSSSRVQFLKDEEGNLSISESEFSDNKGLISIISLITQSIHEGSSTPNAIIGFVSKHFVRPKDVDYMDEDLKESVLTTLKTHPKFKRDSRNNYSVVSNSSSRSRIKPERSSVKRNRSEEDSDDSSGDNEPVRSRGASPPPGYQCRCGATQPGKGPTCKWRKGPSGEYLCNSCGLQYNKKDKKDKRSAKEKEPDSNPWICCDRCHKWVRAKSDNIDDISLYDDSNPNHLDYYCPSCRAKGEQNKDKSRQKSNRRTRLNSDLDDPEPKVEKKSRTNGGSRKRRGEEEDGNDSKLDTVEKELIYSWEKDLDLLDSAIQNEETEKSRMAINKNMDDLHKFKNSLISTRNTIWEKNQKDFEAQVEKLEAEKKALNERAELDLVKQLREFYEKRKPK